MRKVRRRTQSISVKSGMISPTIRYLKTNFDELAIMMSLVAVRDSIETEQDMAVLAAFQRYSGKTQKIDDVRSYLNGLSEDQIAGVVHNVKGILHEMEFVRIENSDGDNVTAAMFSDTNHPGHDIILIDRETGLSQEVQLKATDSKGDVEEWMDKHPDGEIQVSEEMASELDLPTSGLSNQGITVKVEAFVDKLISEEANAPIWDFFPALTLVSVSLVVGELYKRYRSGDISMEQFKSMSARATGIKLAKFAALLVGLSIPGVNVVVGAGIVAKTVYALSQHFEERQPEFT